MTATELGDLLVLAQRTPGWNFRNCGPQTVTLAGGCADRGYAVAMVSACWPTSTIRMRADPVPVTAAPRMLTAALSIRARTMRGCNAGTVTSRVT